MLQSMGSRRIGHDWVTEQQQQMQDPMTALNPVYTVGEQIAEALMIHENLNEKDAMKRAGEMLEMRIRSLE